MARDDSGPIILPFHVEPRTDPPDTLIEEAFDIEGVAHQLTVRIWSDAYEAELVNLASGASCPLAGIPSQDDASPASSSSPSPMASRK